MVVVDTQTYACDNIQKLQTRPATCTHVPTRAQAKLGRPGPMDRVYPPWSCCCGHSGLCSLQGKHGCPLAGLWPSCFLCPEHRPWVLPGWLLSIFRTQWFQSVPSLHCPNYFSSFFLKVNVYKSKRQVNVKKRAKYNKCE